MENKISKMDVEIIKAGIERFYAEGYFKWSKNSFLKLFNGSIEADDPQLKLLIAKWEASGSVKFCNTDECFVEILDYFTD